MLVRAKELASLIGGHALTLADLENYHPEEGMILANTTSIGMHPNVNDTPLSKVFSFLFYSISIRKLRSSWNQTWSCQEPLLLFF